MTPPGCTSTTGPVGACAKSSKPSPYARRYSDGSTISSATCGVCPASTYLEDDATSADLHDSVEDCDVCPAGTYLEDDATSADLHDSVEDCDVCPAGT